MDHRRQMADKAQKPSTTRMTIIVQSIDVSSVALNFRRLFIHRFIHLPRFSARLSVSKIAREILAKVRLQESSGLRAMSDPPAMNGSQIEQAANIRDVCPTRKALRLYLLNTFSPSDFPPTCRRPCRATVPQIRISNRFTRLFDLASNFFCRAFYFICCA